MKIHVKTTNFGHTPAVDALADEKLIRPVQKLIQGIDRAADVPLDVEFELTTRHHRKGKIWRAEAQIELPHSAQLLRAEATGEQLEEAVNRVKDELVGEIKKYKERARKG